MLDFMWRLKEKETIPSAQMNNLVGAYYMCRPSKGPAHIFAKKNESLTVVQQHAFFRALRRRRLPGSLWNLHFSRPAHAPRCAEHRDASSWRGDEQRVCSAQHGRARPMCRAA